MNTREATIRARVPSQLKTETDQIFEALGITPSEAIRIFLGQVRLTRGLPFPLRLPPDAHDNTDLLLSREQRQKALDASDDD
ncbi:MAG: type II toxin-antitoxin system RelB/DinJ family antitoxin [Thermoflexales bacterium]